MPLLLGSHVWIAQNKFLVERVKSIESSQVKIHRKNGCTPLS